MFFSVKSPMKIAGKIYHPCICYPLPEELELTINKLVGEGKAYKFKEPVTFVNGVVFVKQPKEVKKEEKVISKKADKKETVEDEGF